MNPDKEKAPEPASYTGQIDNTNKDTIQNGEMQEPSLVFDSLNHVSPFFDIDPFFRKHGSLLEFDFLQITDRTQIPFPIFKI